MRQEIKCITTKRIQVVGKVLGGMVIGYDNKQVFVRHGGTYIPVSPCNLKIS